MPNHTHSMSLFASRSLARMSGRTRAILLLLFLAVFAAAYGMNRLLHRPGEAAAALIPENAIAIGVLDLKPALNQLMTFRSIASVMDKYGLDQHKPGEFLLYLDSSDWVKEIVPRVQPSAAGAILPDLPYGDRDFTDTRGPQAIVLLAVDDPLAVRAALDRGAKSNSGKHTLFESANCYGALIGEYLALASSTAAIDAVADVQAGRQRPITGNAHFLAARSVLNKEANLMLFGSAQGIVSEVARDNYSDSPIDDGGAEWSAFSMTVGSEGLDFVVRVASKMESDSVLAHLSETKPIRPDLLERMPSGAYAFAALSQPAQLWRTFEAAVSRFSREAEQLQDVMNELDEQTGLNVRGELLPALEGNVVVGLYPEESSVRGLNVLIALDNSNDARPANLTARARELVDRELQRAGQAPTAFSEQRIGSATVYTLAGRPREDLRYEIERSSDSRAVTYLRDKNFAYAEIDGALIASSSEDLLKRAVGTMSGSGASLASDSAFGNRTSTRGAHQMAYLSVARIAESCEELMKTVRPDVPAKHQQLVDTSLRKLKGMNKPVSLTVRFEKKFLVARAFLPLDYDLLGQIASEVSKEFETRNNGSRGIYGGTAGDSEVAVGNSNFISARADSMKNTCISNLKQIESAKEQWAMINKKGPTDTPDSDTLVGDATIGFLKAFPTCPTGGTYTIGSMSTCPSCSEAEKVISSTEPLPLPRSIGHTEWAMVC